MYIALYIYHWTKRETIPLITLSKNGPMEPIQALNVFHVLKACADQLGGH